jgi:hypothetical protein
MANSYTNRLKKRLPAVGDVNWDDEWHDNEKLDDVIQGVLLSSNRILSGGAVTDGGGLTANFEAAVVRLGNLLADVEAGNLVLTAAPAGKQLVNWLYVDADGVVVASLTPPSGVYLPYAMVDTDEVGIVRIADLRAFDQTEKVVENDFINGTFDLWDFAVSQTSSGYNSDNRFSNLHSGSTKTHSRQSFSPGQTEVPGNPDYFSRTIVSSVAGAGNYVKKVQRILGVGRYSGQRVAVKIHGRADAVRNIAIEGVQNFGTGGSAEVTGISSQLVELGAQWDKHVAYIDFPSIAGKTVGALSYCEIAFWFDAGTDFDGRTNNLGQQSGTFELAEIEGYPSAKELSVRRRSVEETLTECKRYYLPGLVWAGTQASTISRILIFNHMNFPVEMIQTPSVQIVAFNDQDATGSAFSSLWGATARGFLGLNVSPSAAAGSRFSFTVNLNAEI